MTYYVRSGDLDERVDDAESPQEAVMIALRRHIASSITLARIITCCCSACDDFHDDTLILDSANAARAAGLGVA